MLQHHSALSDRPRPYSSWPEHSAWPPAAPRRPHRRAAQRAPPPTAPAARPPPPPLRRAAVPSSPSRPIPAADRSPAGTAGTAPTVTVPAGTPPTSLESADLIVGTGAIAAPKDTVTVQYVLATYSSRQGGPVVVDEPALHLHAGRRSGDPGVGQGRGRDEGRRPPRADHPAEPRLPGFVARAGHRDRTTRSSSSSTSSRSTRSREGDRRGRCHPHRGAPPRRGADGGGHRRCRRGRSSAHLSGMARARPGEAPGRSAPLGHRLRCRGPHAKSGTSISTTWSARGPRTPTLASWLRDGCAALAAALEAAPPDLQCSTFLRAPSPLAMWARRQAHETAIHRVDAELAAGLAPSADNPVFAADGADELLTCFVPRRSTSLRMRSRRRRWTLPAPTSTRRGRYGSTQTA